MQNIRAGLDLFSYDMVMRVITASFAKRWNTNGSSASADSQTITQHNDANVAFVVVSFHKGLFYWLLVGRERISITYKLSSDEQLSLEAKTQNVFQHFSLDVLLNGLFSLSNCAELIY